MDVKSLEKRLAERHSAVEDWIRRHAGKVCFPIYSSVDVRDAGFKISAIDANIFPAGFNNLCDAFLEKGARLLREFVTANYGDLERIAIYPESHTRNKYYLQNLHALKSMVERAGYKALVGTLDPKFRNGVTELETFEGQKIQIHRLMRNGEALFSNDFTPELILINNDFADGRPDELATAGTPVTPPPAMGWYVRSKWEHFQIYDSLVKEFAEILSVDPWLLAPLTEFEDDVRFKDGKGIDRVATKIDYLIGRIAAKYNEYGINRKPLVFVKDNAGTYGMGIVVVGSGDEVLNLNRSQRNKMARGKSSSGIRAVIIQECIPTSDYFNEFAGEPVIYMVGDQVLGGFFRYSESKSETESLNAPGTQFAKLCLAGEEDFDDVLACYQGHCSFALYYTIARISCLAMGQEMKNRELCPPAVSHGGIR
ncbi:glutamate--cysteine ligase [Candidatus Poribacteria bacterium]|nr:glutamate--cysteine ligase [Candidatus Poribacteria bacterium]